MSTQRRKERASVCRAASETRSHQTGSWIQQQMPTKLHYKQQKSVLIKKKEICAINDKQQHLQNQQNYDSRNVAAQKYSNEV